MPAYTIEPCEDTERWQEFMQHSPQACVYCEPDVLDSLGCEADYWFVMRSGYPAAAVPVITGNAVGGGLPIHSYYTGPMLHEESWKGKANRRTENLLDITAALMEQLSRNYDRLQFSLHPLLDDVRGFDWFNYHSPELGRAHILPRYTAQLALDEDSIRHSARSSRRREERYAIEREHLHYTEDGSPDELVELWCESLRRQHSEPGVAEREQTRVFAQRALDDGRAIIGCSRDAQGAAQAAGMLLFDHHGRVHLPVVGTSQTRYGGTLLYFRLMDSAAERGAAVIDFNGANSPSRGYFKHSIGGEAMLYFQIEWRRP